jgi:hypothetical protein
MRGGSGRRIAPCLLVPRDLSWEKSRATACRWGHRPYGGAPGYGGQYAAALGRVALDAVTDLPTAVGFSGCDVPTVPVAGASRRGPMDRRRSRSPRPGHRGGVAIDRHTRDELMVRSPRRRCQTQQRSRPRRPRPADLRRFVQWETVIRMTRRWRFAAPSKSDAAGSSPAGAWQTSPPVRRFC